MYTLREKVVRFAVLSRIFVLLLQCIFNAIVPDHKAEDVFERPVLQHPEQSFPDSIVDVLLGGLERWDAHYFLHIAENGYVYENTLAFFPLFPTAVNFLSGCLSLVSRGMLSQRSLSLLVSVSLNTVCFVKAADILFCLSLTVLENQAASYKAALLFCINPASIFFSAPYSEALFVLLSFKGMSYSFHSQFSQLCSIQFGLAAAARSNGILNVGFILYGSVKQRISEKWSILAKKKGVKRKIMYSMKVLPFRHMMECSILAVAPFIIYQVYCYVQFCIPKKLHIQEHVLKFGQQNNLVFPESGENFHRSTDHWCNFKLPLAYSYVQDHYWNVGFLRYYEWKQIPNFVLASPIIILIFWQSKNYFLQHPSSLFHLGLKPEDKKSEEKVKCDSGLSPNMFVFVVHALLLTLFCLAFVHIQVSTRMICSASPVPYWYAAYLLNYPAKKYSNGKSKDGKLSLNNQLRKAYAKKSDSAALNRETGYCTESLENMHSRWRVKILSEVPDTRGKIILAYFVFYTVVGTILFCNFLPWT